MSETSTPPVDTSTAGEWNLMEGDLAVILTGGPVALAANAENAAAIVDAHNSSLAALKTFIEAETAKLREQVRAWALSLPAKTKWRELRDEMLAASAQKAGQQQSGGGK